MDANNANHVHEVKGGSDLPVSELAISNENSQVPNNQLATLHMKNGVNGGMTPAVTVVRSLDTDDEDDHEPTHPYQDRPHGHHHGHSHNLSSSYGLAHTVIVGDVLHNFCDGIAIGAAFAISLRGGLSTSTAVLCHELPHELGDFVVLLRANMSVKAALFYNVLSSLLCAVGAIVGLFLGQMDSVGVWLFLLTAGMFVYIALVDMMPELSTSRLKGNKCCHQPSVLFIWQNIGLLLGYAVMLLIALYEGGLM